MTDLEQIEADLADKNRLPYGVDDAVVRELIAEVREWRAAQPTHPRQWGPWIPWAGGECPIPDAEALEWRYKLGRDEMLTATAHALNPGYKLPWTRGTIIAYRVRLPAEDLLRQAIDALRPFALPEDEMMEMEHWGDWPSLKDIRTARAVLTAYDKRSA